MSDQTELERLRDMVARLQQEAEIHAQEARTQKSIVHECYQAVSGSRGEPGDWNGAKPVVDELERLRAENERLRAGIAAYLDGECDPPCRHRTPYYEACEPCIDAYFESVLNPEES